MELKRKIAVAIASSALIFNAFAPTAFAGTELIISGNGSDSDNEAKVELSTTTTVVQENNADVFNKVEVNANTGNNDASDNTGGDVSVETGDVDTKVDVTNTLNSNSAEVDCCPTNDVDVLISGNGSGSDNDARVDQTNATEVYQYNDADVKNKVYTDGNTGYNDALDNTGGDVSVKTGDVDTTVNISTAANANSAVISGDGNGGSVSAVITGNGADSVNDIDLELVSYSLLAQNNEADVYNKVDVNSDTGHNDANDNTGGDVLIETGDVDTNVDVDTSVNFNWADIECGCLFEDILAKIAGNGADSDNDIRAKLTDAQEVFQTNCGEGEQEWGWWDRKDCEVDNKVFVNSDTGYNDALDNTQGSDSDPTIQTGDATQDVDLSTSGNVNVFGGDGPDFPDFDFDFSLTLDLGDLLDWLLGHA